MYNNAKIYLNAQLSALRANCLHYYLPAFILFPSAAGSNIYVFISWRAQILDVGLEIQVTCILEIA